MSKDTAENRSQDTRKSNDHADQRSYVLGQVRGAQLREDDHGKSIQAWASKTSEHGKGV